MSISHPRTSFSLPVNLSSSTMASRWSLLAGFTLIFVFVELNLLGLFSFKVDLHTHRATQCRTRLIYSTTIHALLFIGYLSTVLYFLADPSLAFFYSGVSYYTIVLWNSASFLLLIHFYGFQIYRRSLLIDFLNDLSDAYPTFALFYSPGRQHFEVLSAGTEDSLREIHHVYEPLFWKGFVCHLLLINVKFLLGYFIHLSCNTANFLLLLFFLTYPYIVQSATSSYLFLGLRKISYLYVAMGAKLKAIHGQVVELAQDTALSDFVKMKRFCEISDQIDSMSISFDRITALGMRLSEAYHMHMLLILGYSVSNNLALLFMQYR